ncbi:hypothetical protein NUSPORA_00119 [Nucleospora cyclopteri]
MFSVNFVDEILREIKHGTILKYNTVAISSLNEENEYIDSLINGLNEEASTMGDIANEISINFAILHKYKERNKRILKTYNLDRLLKINENISNHSFLDESLLSLDEVDYARCLKEIDEEYFADYDYLNVSDTKVPLDFFVQILALEDCGIIMSGDEFVDVKKDHIYFLKKTDITHLIEKKFVQVIEK